MAGTTVVAIATRADVERARREAGRLARDLGFDADGVERVRLAVSELATNLLKYARDGRIGVRPVAGERGKGVQIESHDAGPGIAHVERALRDGHSTGGGLGGGLPGVVRLMDDVAIESGPGGTHITAHLWLTAAS